MARKRPNINDFGERSRWVRRETRFTPSLAAELSDELAYSKWEAMDVTKTYKFMLSGPLEGVNSEFRIATKWP